MFTFSSEQKSVLHLTWVAFFLTFVAWFNMAPFNSTLARMTGLSSHQIDILMICNMVLTIPSRIVIGTLVDRYGPRHVFSALLVFAALVSFYFALATEFSEFLLSRLMMGMVGGGFVVGIKMIAEWFPSQKMGTAQGIYAGWGNFGAAAALFTLPPIASLFPEELGWRVAAGFSGTLCLFWSWVYHRYCQEKSPSASRNFKLGLLNSIEVSSRKDIYLQCLLMVPIYLSVLTVLWKLSGNPLGLLNPVLTWVLVLAILALYALSVRRCSKVNLPNLAKGIPQEKIYQFRQIAILCLVYALTFGSELAVVSMFPGFLESTFGLTVTSAGILGSSYAFMNLFTRPSGGWIADRAGRKRALGLMVSGTIIGFWIMSQIGPHWPVSLAVAAAIGCSLFVQAGNGACFSMVPLVRKDLTGKLAGIVGAYGNVGAVFFMTLLSISNAQIFFKTISGYALLVLIGLIFLKPFKNPLASISSAEAEK